MKRFMLPLLASLVLFGDEPPPFAQLSEGNNSFGWNLYTQVKGETGNLCLSPYSIVSALAIPYVGAKGDTRKEMQKVLHFNEPLEIGGFNAYLTAHPSNYPQSFRVLMGNSLWVQERMALESAYVTDVRKEFKAIVHRVDFVGQMEASRARINRFVSHQTNSKIPELIGKGVLKSSTRAVVTSALYLRAKWMDPFVASKTHFVPFFPSGKKTVNLAMMYDLKKIPYLEEGNMQLIELALEQPAPDAPALVLDFILPTQRDGLQALEKSLSIDTLNAWFEKMQNEDVAITLPKFTIQAGMNLTEVLQKMGMNAPFSPEADFSGITGKKELAISQVIHETYLDVKEGGVEAAAATAVSMALTMAPLEGLPKTFTADHPFLFFLRDRSSGMILFIGRFVEN